MPLCLGRDKGRGRNKAVLATIAEMLEADRALAERLHAIIKTSTLGKKSGELRIDLSASLSEPLYHFHNGCNCGLGLVDHNPVTALVCKKLLAVSR